MNLSLVTVSVADALYFTLLLIGYNNVLVLLQIPLKI